MQTVRRNMLVSHAGAMVIAGKPTSPESKRTTSIGNGRTNRNVHNRARVSFGANLLLTARDAAET